MVYNPRLDNVNIGVIFFISQETENTLGILSRNWHDAKIRCLQNSWKLYKKGGLPDWVTRTVLEQQVMTGKENRDTIAISETAVVQQTENWIWDTGPLPVKTHAHNHAQDQNSQKGVERWQHHTSAFQILCKRIAISGINLQPES